MTSFPEAARHELANVQLRANLRNATDTIRAKRAGVVAELPDWEELREAGKAIKEDVMAHLDRYLVRDFLRQVAESHTSEPVKGRTPEEQYELLLSLCDPASLQSLQIEVARPPATSWSRCRGRSNRDA